MESKKILYAIVKLVENSTNLSISFDHLGKSRTFCRQIEETVGDTLKRVALNINKQLGVSRKKSKKDQTLLGPSTSGQAPIPNVYLIDNSTSEIPTKTINKNAWKTGNTLMINETAYKVALNPPNILRLELPKAIMSCFPITPLIDYEFASLESSKLQWYVKENKNCDDVEWLAKANGMKFIPGNDLIGFYVKLKCYAGNETEEWPIPQEVISTEPITCGPGYCPFDQRHLIAGTITNNDTIRIMSYNILADCYASSDFAQQHLFSYCPQYALDMTYRRQLLLKEITGFNSHIVCLQECDEKHFDHFFKPAMNGFGYEGLFSGKAGETPEGEALFYNKNKFTFIKSSRIVFKEAVHTIDNFHLMNFLDSQPDMKEELLRKSTIGQINLLRDNYSSKYIFILNTHLYFRANYDHFRLIQMYTLIEALNKFILEQKLESNSYAIIVCGDFNSLPDSAVIEFLSTSQILCDHPVWKFCDPDLVENFAGISLQLPFNLKNFSGFPDFTNLTNGFKGTLDYIFGNNKLIVNGIVPISDQKELETYNALPSVVSPSDHVPLICDLEWQSN